MELKTDFDKQAEAKKSIYEHSRKDKDTEAESDASSKKGTKADKIVSEGGKKNTPKATNGKAEADKSSEKTAAIAQKQKMQAEAELRTLANPIRHVWYLEETTMNLRSQARLEKGDEKTKLENRAKAQESLLSDLRKLHRRSNGGSMHDEEHDKYEIQEKRLAKIKALYKKHGVSFPGNFATNIVQD